jgi:hypothetical protein
MFSSPCASQHIKQVSNLSPHPITYTDRPKEHTHTPTEQHPVTYTDHTHTHRTAPNYRYRPTYRPHTHTPTEQHPITYKDRPTDPTRAHARTHTHTHTHTHTEQHKAHSLLRTSLVIFVFRPFSKTCIVQEEFNSRGGGVEFRAELLKPSLVYRTVAVAYCCYCQNCRFCQR